MKHDSLKEALLSVKFGGKELDVRAVPIYELGDTLIAVQRIVHKMFLHEHARLKRGAHLTRDERQRLSLQISERKRSSDLYALVPFVADPIAQHYVSTLVKSGLSVLAKYAAKKVLPALREEAATSIEVEALEGAVQIGAIYAETVQITNHINNIGGVETIELLPAYDLKIQPVTFTADTQKYVRQIANETIKGPLESITGTVTRLYPNRLIAEIKLRPGRHVKVQLDDRLFHHVRYNTEQGQKIVFEGYPIIRLGKDALDFKEFNAVRVR